MLRTIARRSAYAAIVACGLALANQPAGAQAQKPVSRDVDVALVLSVDVSYSMTPDELQTQREGYAAAMADDQVWKAIGDGALGRIAVTYIEWAGTTIQRIVIPWRIIASRADARAFADSLKDEVPRSAGRTSISGGLRFATDLLAKSGLKATRQVIDVSGDGPNNEGEPVTSARDAAVAHNITINGLPLMTHHGEGRMFDIPDLDVYYSRCVIGGPNAFMLPVNDWKQFPEAVRRKLIMELASDTSPRFAAVGPADATPIRVAGQAPYDCLVGEERWHGRPWNLDVR